MTAATQPAGSTGLPGRLYQGWLEIAASFGEVQTLVILFFIYSAVIGPMATIARLLRRDFLHKRGLFQAGSAWNDADTVSRPDLDRARRMF